MQGVAWDPVDDYIVSLSSDRTARVYSSACPTGKKKKPSKDKEGASKEPSDEATPRAFSCHTVLAKRTLAITPPSPIKSASATALSADASAAAPVATADQVAAAADTAAAAEESSVGPAKGEADGARPEASRPTKGEEPMASSPGASKAVADGKGPAGGKEGKEGQKPTKVHMFMDDTIASFYRRPEWAPDGSFLLLPCGQYYDGPPGTSPALPTVHVVARSNLAVPCAHLPSPDKAVIAVRFSPLIYEHPAAPTASSAATPSASADADTRPPSGAGAKAEAESSSGWMTSLPYRILWAVATLDSIVIYDSSQRQPLLVASNVHYAALTDLSWLPDGRGLVASSMDGYCTILRIKPSALGTPVPKSQLPACMRPKAAVPPAPVPNPPPVTVISSSGSRATLTSTTSTATLPTAAPPPTAASTGAVSGVTAPTAQEATAAEPAAAVVPPAATEGLAAPPPPPAETAMSVATAASAADSSIASTTVASAAAPATAADADHPAGLGCQHAPPLDAKMGGEVSGFSASAFAAPSATFAAPSATFAAPSAASSSAGGAGSAGGSGRPASSADALPPAKKARRITPVFVSSL